MQRGDIVSVYGKYVGVLMGNSNIARDKAKVLLMPDSLFEKDQYILTNKRNVFITHTTAHKNIEVLEEV